MNEKGKPLSYSYTGMHFVFNNKVFLGIYLKQIYFH